jgi:hypothetical protein
MMTDIKAEKYLLLNADGEKIKHCFSYSRESAIDFFELFFQGNYFIMTESTREISPAVLKCQFIEFSIYDYDIVGNKIDGYEVNNVYQTEFKVKLKKNYNKKQIIQKLKKCGYLKKGLHSENFYIDGEFDYTFYLTYTGRNADGFLPVCELRNNR